MPRPDVGPGPGFRSFATLAVLVAVAGAPCLSGCSSSSSSAGDGGSVEDRASGMSSDVGEDAVADGSPLDSTAGDSASDAPREAPAEGSTETGSPDAGPTYLCGSAVLRAAPDSGTGPLLTSVGLTGVAGLWKDGDYVVGANFNGGWILWNAATGLAIASATTGTPIGLAGGVLAVSNSGQINVFSAANARR